MFINDLQLEKVAVHLSRVGNVFFHLASDRSYQTSVTINLGARFSHFHSVHYYFFSTLFIQNNIMMLAVSIFLRIDYFGGNSSLLWLSLFHVQCLYLLLQHLSQQVIVENQVKLQQIQVIIGTLCILQLPLIIYFIM